MTTLLSFEQKQFNGGMNSYSTDDTLAPNESSELVNVKLNPRFHSIEKFGGTQWAASIDTQDNAQFEIESMYRFYLSTGLKYNLVHYYDNVNLNRNYIQCYDSQWNTNVQLAPTTPPANPISDWAVYQNNIYFVNGDSIIYSWDGDPTNTTGSEEIAPISFEPSLIEMYNGRAYYAGDTTNPSRLIVSRPATPTTFDTPFVEPVYEINNSDGDKITSIKVLGSNLIVFKQNSFYIVEGSLPRRITQHPSVGIGALSDKTVQKTPAGLVFLSYQGIQLFDGTTVRPISTKVRSDLNDVIRSADVRFSSSYHNNTYYLFYKTPDLDYINEGYAVDMNEVIFGGDELPVLKLENYRVGGSVVYTGADEQERWYYFFDNQANAIVQMDMESQNTIYVDASTTVNVDPTIVTQWYDCGNRAVLKEFRMLYLYAHREIGQAKIKIYYSKDGNDFTETLDLPSVSGGSVWGSAIWGTSLWGTPSTGYRYKIPLPTGVIGNRMRIEFYSDTTAYINMDRLAIHYRQMREY